jgi:hypothetical protein
VSGELKRLVEDASYRAQIFGLYSEVYDRLNIGSASETAALKMFQYLREG